MGQVPAASYSFVNDTLQILNANAYDRERLQRLYSAVNAAQEAGDTDGAVDAIKREAPELARYLRRVVAPEAMNGWIAVLLAIIFELLRK